MADFTIGVYDYTILNPTQRTVSVKVNDITLDKYPSLTETVVYNDMVYTLTSMSYCFSNCAALVTAPRIPNSVKYIAYCFYNCVSLQKMPGIPASILGMNSCFEGCSNIQGNLSVKSPIPYNEHPFGNTLVSPFHIYIVNNAQEQEQEEVKDTWRLEVSMLNTQGTIHYETDDAAVPTLILNAKRVNNLYEASLTGDYAGIEKGYVLDNDFIPGGYDPSEVVKQRILLDDTVISLPAEDYPGATVRCALQEIDESSHEIIYTVETNYGVQNSKTVSILTILALLDFFGDPPNKVYPEDIPGMGMSIGKISTRNGLDIQFPTSIGNHLIPSCNFDYVLTEDTTVDTSKTYYKITFVPSSEEPVYVEVTPVGNENPHQKYWHERINLGVNLKNYQLIVGEYNKIDDDAYLIIGNGEEEARHNLFTVKNDGLYVQNDFRIVGENGITIGGAEEAGVTIDPHKTIFYNREGVPLVQFGTGEETVTPHIQSEEMYPDYTRVDYDWLQTQTTTKAGVTYNVDYDEKIVTTMGVSTGFSDFPFVDRNQSRLYLNEGWNYFLEGISSDYYSENKDYYVLADYKISSTEYDEYGKDYGDGLFFKATSGTTGIWIQISEGVDTDGIEWFGALGYLTYNQYLEYKPKFTEGHDNINCVISYTNEEGKTITTTLDIPSDGSYVSVDEFTARYIKNEDSELDQIECTYTGDPINMVKYDYNTEGGDPYYVILTDTPAHGNTITVTITNNDGGNTATTTFVRGTEEIKTLSGFGELEYSGKTELYLTTDLEDVTIEAKYVVADFPNLLMETSYYINSVEQFVSFGQRAEASVIGAGSLSSGIQNSVSGQYATALGTGLIARGSNQLVIGQYNENGINNLFEIGNGTEEDNRSNALTVDSTGCLTTYITNAYGLIIKQNQTGKDAMLATIHEDTGTQVDFGVGTGGYNHGVYSRSFDKWLIFADASRNDNDRTALNLTNATTARQSIGAHNASNLTAGTLPGKRLPIMFQVRAKTSGTFSVSSGSNYAKDVILDAVAGYELVGCIGFTTSHNQATQIGSARATDRAARKITITGKNTGGSNFTDMTVTAYGLFALTNIV